mmetsp:Transcript_7677/g.8673  ORF Transcript_7677/g.8673 Transcript_7677/m.8673 type:complete len:120 (-) Transcript_7677:39-398(-)
MRIHKKNEDKTRELESMPIMGTEFAQDLSETAPLSLGILENPGLQALGRDLIFTNAFITAANTIMSIMNSYCFCGLNEVEKQEPIGQSPAPVFRESTEGVKKMLSSPDRLSAFKQLSKS